MGRLEKEGQRGVCVSGRTSARFSVGRIEVNLVETEVIESQAR